MFQRISSKHILNRCKLSNKIHHRTYNTSHYILPVFNLSEYCPNEAIENYLHSIHDNIGLPYLFGIFTIPFLTKFLIRLPLDTISTKIYEQSQHLLPDINENKFETLLTILQNKQETESEIWRKYINLSMKQFQIKLTYYFPSLITFYIHLSTYIAIESMTFHEHTINNKIFLLTNDYLSSTDPYFILPIINGFGMMFCYAIINKYKTANFKHRRRNIKLCVLFMPFSALFLSSAFQFYILSNLFAIILYQKCTMQNNIFLKQFGLLNNETKYELSNVAQMSNLYIGWNKTNFTSNVIGVFTKSFANDNTVLKQNFEAVLNNNKLFIPAIPPRGYFRNIEDEIEYFDDEYDDFIQRIEDKHHKRYLETNKHEIYIQEAETLLLDDEIDTKQTHKLTD